MASDPADPELDSPRRRASQDDSFRSPSPTQRRSSTGRIRLGKSFEQLSEKKPKAEAFDYTELEEHSPKSRGRRKAWGNDSPKNRFDSPSSPKWAKPLDFGMGEWEEEQKPSYPRVRRASFTFGLEQQTSRIAIVVNGTRGDIQPMIALAREITTRFKNVVRIFTNADHVNLCRGFDTDVVPVFADTHSVMMNVGGLEGSKMDPNFSVAARQWLRENPSKCVSVTDALEDFGAHLMITGTNAFRATFRSEVESGAPQIPVMISRHAMEYNKLYLNSPPPRPAFYAVSETLDMETIPSGMMRVGSMFMHDMPAAAELAEGGHLAELAEFLSQGSAPVAIGWGSMLPKGMPAVAMLEVALHALMLAGERGVVLGGWARLDRLGHRLVSEGTLAGLTDAGTLADFARKRVCFVPSAPHAWLFPQCCCCVHHGGWGTTQQAMDVGCPQVVTPIAYDQFDAAAQVRRLRIGVGFDVALAQIPVPSLGTSIRQTMGPEVRHAAKLHTGRLTEEDGTRDLAEYIDTFLRTSVLSGRWGDAFQRTQAARC